MIAQGMLERERVIVSGLYRSAGDRARARAAGPVAVGVEVDRDDPAAAAAQQRQRAHEHVAATGRLDGVAPWSCGARVDGAAIVRGAVMADMAVAFRVTPGPVATAPAPEGPVVA